jgi:hypothetical protein
VAFLFLLLYLATPAVAIGLARYRGQVFALVKSQLAG